MDNFHEEVVKNNTGRAFRTFLYYLSWVFLIISALIAAMLIMGMVNAMSFNLVQALVAALFGGTAFLLLRNKDRLHTEYEYTLTNGDMDFAVVFGNVRRKHLMGLSLKLVEAAGDVQTGDFSRYDSMPGIKKTDLTLNDDRRKVFLYYIKEGNKNLLILEPSDKLVGLLSKYNPRIFSF